MQFFAENPTHCLNPARPPRWYQRHSPGQRAAMKGNWEEYRGWDWKNMPLPYPPLYTKKKKRGCTGWRRKKGEKRAGNTVVYTPVYYPGMTEGRYNPAEQVVAANLHQYSRQARAEQQAYLEQQAQIQAILQQQQRQAEADRQAYIQYLRETESERLEYMEREGEAAHAEYLQQEAAAQHAAWVHQQRMNDPVYRAYYKQQQAEAERQAYLQQEEQMRQARAAQKAAEARGERKSSYYTSASHAHTEPMTPAEKIMSTYISQAQAHAAEVMRSQEIAQQQQFAQQPSFREPSPPPPPVPPKPPSYYPSPRRPRRH